MGQLGGDGCAALYGRFDHEHRVAKASNDAVSARKIACSGGNPKRPLRNPCPPGLEDALGEPRVGARLRGVEAVGQHRPGRKPRPQGLAVGGRVDAQSQPADDRGLGRPERVHPKLGVEQPIGCGRSRTDHREHPVALAKGSANKQQRRRVAGMRKPGRIVGRLNRDAANPVVRVLLHRAANLVQLVEHRLVPTARNLLRFLLKRGKRWGDLAEPVQGLLVLRFQEAQRQEVFVFFSHGPKVARRKSRSR